MKTSHRRFALLTGASLTALGVTGLGVATPALAAPHDAFTAADTGTYAGTSTATATLTICDIAATNPCFYGEYLTGSGAVTATVNSTATGRIAQADTGGTITLSLVNPAGSSAEIGAIAIATGAGNQTADANVTTALTQNASATTGDAVNTFTNDGSLLIDAVAVASASTGGADASAYNYAGAWQYATVALGGVGNASNSIVNNGTYTALASASAVAPSGFALSGREPALWHLSIRQQQRHGQRQQRAGQ